jgi:glycerate dehydrogenase
MKIVVLDGYTLNPGDLSWSALEALAPVTIYDRTPSERITERAMDAEIILTNKTPLSATTITSLPKLAYIGVLATGYNVVDTDAARARKIPVTNVPTYGTVAVAQLVFAHILEHCHHVADHSAAVRSGSWQRQPDFCFWNHPLFELAGKTIGIVGFGRIGRQVGLIASSFGMKVRAFDTQRADPPSEITDFGWVELDELFGKSDVVSLHCPLFPQTAGLVNSSRLELMKPTAILVNASRGGLVVDADLARALNSSRIAGASLDVVSNIEPPAPENPLLSAKNCFITPHIAWAAKEARERLMATAVSNVAAFLAGSPENVVNPAN